MRRAITVIAVVASLSACDTNQQNGGLLGAGAGGALGGLLGNAVGKGSGKTTSTVIGAVGGALAGYFVGSAIGSKLDSKDRTKAETATTAALHQPTQRARPIRWKSDHSGNNGQAQLVEVEPASGGGGECRTVREIAYIKGEEVTQNSKYCRSPAGEWVSA
jgi:surface antigen